MESDKKEYKRQFTSSPGDREFRGELESLSFDKPSFIKEVREIEEAAIKPPTIEELLLENHKLKIKIEELIRVLNGTFFTRFSQLKDLRDILNKVLKDK